MTREDIRVLKPSATCPALRPVSGNRTANSSPPDSANVIAGAELLSAPSNHLGEHLITGRVAMRIVDGFEMVEVEHDAAEIAVVPSSPLDFFVALGEERPARHGPGQRIDECELAEFELVDDKTTEVLKNIKLFFANFPRLHIHHAQGANVVPARRAKWHTYVLSDMRIASNQRTIAKPAVGESVLHDECLVLADRVRAKGDIPWRFV
jgi:hypothetical protein